MKPNKACQEARWGLWAAILQTLHDTVVKSARNQAKGVPYHAGFLPYTYPKEFGCGATSFVKLHCKYILYIIYGFNILCEILMVEETSIGTDNTVLWGAGVGAGMLVFIGNWKMCFPVFLILLRLDQKA